MTTDWRWGVSPRDPEVLRRHLDDRMQALARKVEDLDRAQRFGPLPGALLPVYLTYSDPGGMAALVGFPVALSGIAFEARPRQVYLTVFGAGATVTVRVRNAATNILAADQAVSTGAPVTLGDSSDFAVDKVFAPDLNLFLVSIDAGTPIHLLATVILDHVQKVRA